MSETTCTFALDLITNKKQSNEKTKKDFEEF